MNDKYDEIDEKRDFRAAFTGTKEGDIPILEELGININTIVSESKFIFKSMSMKNVQLNFLESPDLTGPIFLLLIFSLALILNRKFHFGYIYFLSISSTSLMYFLFNVMAGEVSYIQVASVMGYCLGPVLIFGLLNIILYFNKLRLIFSVSMSVWSGFATTSILTNFLDAKEARFLLMVPASLLYFGFCCLLMF